MRGDNRGHPVSDPHNKHYNMGETTKHTKETATMSKMELLAKIELLNKYEAMMEELKAEEKYDELAEYLGEYHLSTYEEGMEPYYPINDAENNRLAEQYRLLAEQESDVHFGGRLAEYRYYDMAPIVEKALNQFGYE